MSVPAVPALEWQTLFIWPGLQPLQGGSNFLPIDNGVLQPVLTWGSSCAPNPNGVGEEGWWISAQYVNTVGKEPGFTGCAGADRMAVNPGDSLKMVMALRTGTTFWDQTVTNLANGKSVSFSIDLKGGWHANPAAWTVSDIVLSTAPGTTAKCETTSNVQSQLPGNTLVCSEAVANGNVCKVASCAFSKRPASRPRF